MEPTVPGALARPLPRAAALVAVEGVLLIGLALLYAVRGVLDAPQSVVGTELGAALVAALGVLLVVLARALTQARSWSRSPVLVVQLLGLLTAFSLAQGRVWPAAVVVGALAAGTLQALLSSDGRAAFEGNDQRHD